LEWEWGEVLNKRLQGEGKYGEIRKLVAEMEKLKEGLDILESFKEAVERGKGRFISYAKEAFENALNEHFLNFFGFSDHFIRIEVDENFEPVFHTAEGVEVKRGRELSVNRVGLSGGQRTALGLVYRLALRGLFPNSPQILLLDEPTTHLDEERRRVVWRILWRISEEKDIQIIAVTHDDAVEEVISKENIIRLG
jgi:exonuclease SbcC